MKKTLYIIMVVAMATLLSGCNDWLREDAPGSTKLEDFFTDGTTALQSVNACYTPLMWELQGTYFSEWFVGDIASDDAVKGGEHVLDMAAAYDIENFKTVASNELLLQYYRAQYQGIARCNFSLSNVPDMPVDTIMTAPLKDRYVGEAKFLRAYYYFRLVRMFGGVPKVDFVVDSSEEWKQPRATAEDIYTFILSDLEDAEQKLQLKSEMAPEDLGRATKGAAQAMLMKVNLYMKNYDEARQWGEKVITSGEYDLNPDYYTNFLIEGENGIESVFEVQYVDDPTSDYGEGNGFSRGTFTTILTRSRSTTLTGGKAGWGFNKPSQDLYDEYEEGDPRRDLTIINPSDAQIENREQEIPLGCRYLNRKYANLDSAGGYLTLSHQSRGEQNRREIRYSDVLLMYAEACLESGQDLDKGKEELNRVRSRVGLGEVELTEENLRHERRVELAMEGHRWFDLCRWGIAGDVMNAYRVKYGADNANGNIEGSHMEPFVVGKHELMPIPAEEVRLGGLSQNNGYY